MTKSCFDLEASFNKVETSYTVLFHIIIAYTDIC